MVQAEPRSGPCPLQKRRESGQRCFVDRFALAVLAKAARGDSNDWARLKDNKQHPTPALPLPSPMQPRGVLNTDQIPRSFPRSLASHRLLSDRSDTVDILVLTPLSFPSSDAHFATMIGPCHWQSILYQNFSPGFPVFQIHHLNPSITLSSRYISSWHPANNSLRYYCGDLPLFLHRIFSMFCPLPAPPFFISLTCGSSPMPSFVTRLHNSPPILSGGISVLQILTSPTFRVHLNSSINFLHLSQQL